MNVDLKAGDIRRVQQVVTRLLAKKKLKSDLEAQLAAVVAEEREIEFDILPTLCHELQFTEIMLDGAIHVKVGPFYKASIPADPTLKEKAFAWLRKNKFDGLIKREIKSVFAAGHDKDAQAVVDFLRKHGYSVDDKEAVHHMTLTAFVKEQIEKGNAKLPLDLLGAFVGEKATLKLGD